MRPRPSARAASGGSATAPTSGSSCIRRWRSTPRTAPFWGSPARRSGGRPRVKEEDDPNLPIEEKESWRWIATALIVTSKVSPVVNSPPFEIVSVPVPPANWPTPFSPLFWTTPPAEIVRIPETKLPRRGTSYYSMSRTRRRRPPRRCLLAIVVVTGFRDCDASVDVEFVRGQRPEDRRGQIDFRIVA